jgi:WD40 repeat protein
MPESSPTTFPSPTLDISPTPLGSNVTLSILDSNFLYRPPGARPLASLALSPDNQIFAWGGWGHDIYLLDSHSAKIEHVLKGHYGSIRGLSWSQDGKYLASSSGDGSIRIWHTGSWDVYQIMVWDKHIKSDPSWSHFISMSPDGTQVAAFTGEQQTLDRYLIIWEIASGKVITEMRHAWSFAWSSDGTKWAVGLEDEPVVNIYDASLGQIESVIDVDSQPVDSIAWSQDGTKLWTITRDRISQLWDVSDGKHERTIKKLSVCNSFSPDRMWLVTGTEFGKLRIIDASTGKDELTLEAALDRLCLLHWSLDGRTLITGAEETARIWTFAEVLSGTIMDDEETQKGESAPVVITLENIDALTQIRELNGPSGAEQLAWSPDGSMLAAVGDRGLTVWMLGPDSRLTVLKELKTIRGESLSWSFDGSRLAIAGHGNLPTKIVSVKTWSVISSPLEEISKWSLYEGEFSYHGDEIAFSSSNDMIAAADGSGEIEIWDSSDWEFLQRIISSTVYDLELSPNNEMLAAGLANNTVRIWDAGNGQLTKNLDAHAGNVWSVSWSPEGDLLASTGDDGKVIVWNTDTWEEVTRLFLPTKYGIRVDWSPNGNMLAASGGDRANWHGDASTVNDMKVNIWNREDWSLITAMGGFSRMATGLEWSPDGTMIAVGDSSGKIRLWGIVP